MGRILHVRFGHRLERCWGAPFFQVRALITAPPVNPTPAGNLPGSQLHPAKAVPPFFYMATSVNNDLTRCLTAYLLDYNRENKSMTLQPTPPTHTPGPRPDLYLCTFFSAKLRNGLKFLLNTVHQKLKHFASP